MERKTTRPRLVQAMMDIWALPDLRRRILFTLGILVAFGLFKIVVGLYFKTPVPVQPMKAIGAAAIAGGEGFVPASLAC